MNEHMEDSFKEWFISNNLLDDNMKLSLDKNNYISFDDIISILSELSNEFKKLKVIDIDIIKNNSYKTAKIVINLLIHNKNKFNDDRYELYLEIMNYYLKYILTSFVKKEDINECIKMYRSCGNDISQISIMWNIIYEELSKWPYFYVIIDDKNQYLTTNIKKDNYQTLCIPIYSDKELIRKELLKNNKILKIKLNLLLEEIDKDKNNHAPVIVVNPNFNENINVFINIDEAFWYYYADLSNYF